MFIGYSQYEHGMVYFYNSFLSCNRFSQGKTPLRKRPDTLSRLLYSKPHFIPNHLDFCAREKRFCFFVSDYLIPVKWHFLMHQTQNYYYCFCYLYRYRYCCCYRFCFCYCICCLYCCFFCCFCRYYLLTGGNV